MRYGGRWEQSKNCGAHCAAEASSLAVCRLSLGCHASVVLQSRHPLRSLPSRLCLHPSVFPCMPWMSQLLAGCSRHHRRQLLGSVLQGAPRELVQEVLRLIDGAVELGERSDDEIILVRQLLVDLNEDIRCCRNTFFKMKSDWLAGRWTGVVVSEENGETLCCGSFCFFQCLSAHSSR